MLGFQHSLLLSLFTFSPSKHLLYLHLCSPIPDTHFKAQMPTLRSTVNSPVSQSAMLFSSLVSTISLSCLRCPVFRRLREEAEKRKRPSWNELKSRKGDRESPGDAKHSATQSRNPTRDQPEPGMINPAYEECEDGM